MKQCLYLLGEDGEKKIIFLAALFLISSILDVVGLGMIGAFLSLILNYQQLLMKCPLWVRDYLSQFTAMSVFSVVGGLSILIFIVKAIVGIYSQRRTALFSAKKAAEVRVRFMKQYFQASYIYHLQQNTAHVLNRLKLVDMIADGVIIASLNLIANCFLVFGITAGLLFFHPVITLYLIGLFSFVVLIYIKAVKKKTKRLGAEVSMLNGESNKSVLEALGGILEIRILGKESFFLKQYSRVAFAYAKVQSFLAVLKLIPRYSVESSAAVFLIFLTMASLWGGAEPKTVIPILGIYVAACLRLLPVINQLIIGINSIQSCSYAVSSFYEELRSLESHYDKAIVFGGVRARERFSHISLNSISYNYPGSIKPSLSGVNIDICRGDSIGIIGTTGAGKSTLINIILGVLKPTLGEILVDGKDVCSISGWMRNFAYIPQHIFILDDSLKKNVAMGISDESIDEARLYNAISMAQLNDVVNGLPCGVDTMLGQNGMALSGGQRQRVALARAFYHECDVIVMDEATSALDNTTEAEVISAIKNLKGFKTLIIIAHRLSTIEHCDVVYKLLSGRVVARGSFDQVVGAEALSS